MVFFLPDWYFYGIVTDNMQIHTYEKVAKAITFIKENFRSQPSLETIAAHVHVSPYHFQRLFTDWAGVSPKKFLQYVSLVYAKKLLAEKQYSLFDVAAQTGLSGSGRLHDLFVTIEAMTPGEFKNGGEDLSIQFSFGACIFGNLIIASTDNGICYTAFYDTETAGIEALKQKFPNARYNQEVNPLHQKVLDAFNQGGEHTGHIKLHLKGSSFQLKVWEALLKIPEGQVSTYKTIAGQIEKPLAVRAVGSAIGDNPVAFIIPCHRVIQSGGALGGYMWGETRKTALIAWESALTK